MAKWLNDQNPMEENKTENEHLLDVKKIIGGREKTSIVDVRDVNWEQISGVWKNDAGWEPQEDKDIKKLERWIKKLQLPIKEAPITGDSKLEGSWKEVVEIQRKTEEKFQRENKTPTRPITNEVKKKSNSRLLLFYVTLSTTVAIILAILYLSLIPDIESIKNNLGIGDKTQILSIENNKEVKNLEEVMDSNKAYFMKYIIEESIWKAKVKGTLYAKAEGKVNIRGLKDYTNLYETASEVINRINKMFDNFGKKSDLTITDLQKELELFEKALSAKTAEEESQSKKILCYLTSSRDVNLGTYPSKKVAERANKEKWISPLGGLHEATTGKSQRGRYTTDPNDPRSVGEPVRWKPLDEPKTND